MTDNVLTVIAGPGFSGPWPVVLRLAAEALERLGASVAPADWLAADIAVDLPFRGLDPAPAEAAARAAVGHESIAPALDLVAQPQAGRHRRLLVADMESTVI